MDIGQIKKIIQNYLKGKASPEEQKWMEQWQEKAETEALETPDTGTYRHIKAQILQKIRQHATLSVPVPSGKKNTFPFRKSRWQHAAVSLSVLVVICFISFHYRYALLDLVNPVKEITVTTLAWEVRKVTLPDNSVVTLNTSGVVTFPEHFRGNKRKVSLTGEAYFEVRKDPGRPFIVDAGEIQVKVLGTSFIVSNSASQQEARVAVRTGKVAVTPHQTKTSIVLPHEALIYDKQKNSRRIDHQVEVNTQWTTKQFVFRSTSIPKVFNALEEHFGITILTSDPAIQALTFTGTFSPKDSLPEIFKIIDLSYGLEIQHVNNQLIRISMKKE
jgi:ferric-dicitrate binding protein FerR (iron transport regulator)